MNAHKFPPTLDVKRATEAGLDLHGSSAVSLFDRLTEQTEGIALDALVGWRAHFSTQEAVSGQPQLWLQLTFDVSLPMTCQRCLETVVLLVSSDRRFRFVDSEAVAEREDDESDEDLLVVAREFDLAALLEDEILMSLPLLPRHEVCPVTPKRSAVDVDFVDEPDKPNPFAALANLKASKPH